MSYFINIVILTTNYMQRTPSYRLERGPARLNRRITTNAKAYKPHKCAEITSFSRDILKGYYIDSFTLF